MGPSSDPRDYDGSNRGEEGPISPDQLETRNTERSVLTLDINVDKIDVENLVYADGGIEPSELVEQHGQKIDDLLTKAIILAGLLLLVLGLWRIGSIVQLLDTVLA